MKPTKIFALSNSNFSCCCFFICSFSCVDEQHFIKSSIYIHILIFDKIDEELDLHMVYSMSIENFTDIKTKHHMTLKNSCEIM